MKSIISINSKFMTLNPVELIDLITNSKHTKGLEVCVDANNKLELDYLDKLVFEIKKNNLILQIHGEVELDMNSQIIFMNKLENYSDYLGYPIVVTMHSKINEDRNKSIIDTTNYIEELLTKIDSNKIVISIENLNDMNELDRLAKEYIEPLILNNEKVYFTFDMGHEMVDFGSFTNLDKYMIEDIRNVHLHTFDLYKREHLPIYKNDKYWNNIIKAITYLKTINYKYNIVYEYDLYRCYGETIKEKVIDYLKSIDMVSEHYN